MADAFTNLLIAAVSFLGAYTSWRVDTMEKRIKALEEQGRG